MPKRTQSNDGIVIVGGGLAGQRCAETLRRHGYAGRLRMVCDEPHRPYDRPPLSKGVLTGTTGETSTMFRSTEWYAQQEIDLLLHTPARSLDPRAGRLRLADGTTLVYDQLLIATGSRPRELPGQPASARLSILRTLDDAGRLRDVLRSGGQLAIIGAGFVGQEVASSARSLDMGVTMIEAGPGPLTGLLGPRLAAWFTQLHRSEGVEVRTDCTVDRIIENGSLRLYLSDRTAVEADHVLVGVGVSPNVEWLTGSGLAAASGVPVDAHGRTGCPRVFAAGDVAATFDPIAGAHVPGSHWEAAGRQGARAARAMLGLEPGEVPVTSFWTDQHGLRIQYLGHARRADSIDIDGELEARNFTALFKRAGRAVAALLVNRPRSLPAVRGLIEKGAV